MDLTTFDDFVDRYGADVYRAARFYTADAQTAEDVTQEVFLVVLRKLDRIAEPERWLAKVTRNKARNALRTASRRREVAMSDALDGTAPSTDEVDRLYERSDVILAIDRLPDYFREVIVLRYFEGLEPREIATVMHVAAGTVRSRLHRAHTALRVILEGSAGV